MSVKRWDWGLIFPLTLNPRDREAIELGRHETEDGQFVLYTDYAALESRLAAAGKVVAAMRNIEMGNFETAHDAQVMANRALCALNPCTEKDESTPLRATEAKAPCEHGCVDGMVNQIEPGKPAVPCPSCNPKEAKP